MKLLGVLWPVLLKPGKLSLMAQLAGLIMGGAGSEYHIGRIAKLKLTMRVLRNLLIYSEVTKARSSPAQHFVLIEEVLRLPKSLKGDVVECGCYNGGSAISLSLACALTNRKLIVCDSFAGLPEPTTDEQCDMQPHLPDYYFWEEGEFCSEGGLAGVRRNIETLGDIRCCRFVKGYFKASLGDIGTQAIALIFEDADLRSSVEECLRYLWPKLQEGCRFYCHEPWSVHVVSLFYDRAWWEQNMNTQPPGFYGSGRGILKAGRYTDLGFAVKADWEKMKCRGKKRVHGGSTGFVV